MEKEIKSLNFVRQDPGLYNRTGELHTEIIKIELTKEQEEFLKLKQNGGYYSSCYIEFK